MAVPTNPENAPSNGTLIARMFGLAWRYRMRCCQVLGLQLVLLTLGLSGLSLTGVGIDYVRHVLSERGDLPAENPVPFPPERFGFELPREWAPMKVIVLIAGLILALAVTRAGLNYLYTMAVNKLVQQEIVIHLMGSPTEKRHPGRTRRFSVCDGQSIWEPAPIASCGLRRAKPGPRRDRRYTVASALLICRARENRTECSSRAPREDCLSAHTA